MVSRVPPSVAAAMGLGARRGVVAASKAMQVDPGLTALGSSACSLKCDKPLSRFAFNFNLHCYE